MKDEPATFRSSDRGLYRSCDPQRFHSQNPLHAPGTKLEWSLSIDTSETTDCSAHLLGVVSLDRTDEGQGLRTCIRYDTRRQRNRVDPSRKTHWLKGPQRRRATEDLI